MASVCSSGNRSLLPLHTISDTLLLERSRCGIWLACMEKGKSLSNVIVDVDLHVIGQTDLKLLQEVSESRGPTRASLAYMISRFHDFLSDF